ncbi:hypothetical protein [Nocardioides sp.]|uniref:hypothetical protein n=1 Tax=Nocardioides sp. TaxID=35761 RepID=UPI002B278002|nr:hypothetical protein [Nocardioides sp.]
MDAVPARRPSDDRSLLRISDDDRPRVEEVLRRAAGEGRGATRGPKKFLGSY